MISRTHTHKHARTHAHIHAYTHTSQEQLQRCDWRVRFGGEFAYLREESVVNKVLVGARVSFRVRVRASVRVRCQGHG